MTFSDTEMMELGIKQPINILNTRSLIRTVKYVLDILQTEEASTVENINTHTHTHTHTHRVHQNYFHRQVRINIQRTFYIILLHNDYTISNTTKKNGRYHERKTEPPTFRSTEESIVNQTSFIVLSILYITNCFETRKINSNEIRVLFLLLNFQKSRNAH